MGVKYHIYKIDPEPYRDWITAFNIDELDDDQYDQAMDKKKKFVSYPTGFRYRQPYLFNTQ